MAKTNGLTAKGLFLRTRTIVITPRSSRWSDVEAAHRRAHDLAESEGCIVEVDMPGALAAYRVDGRHWKKAA